MSQPIVIAHHLIWTAYGTWLPNDPRGSGSHEIRNEVLADLGEVHFGRKKSQPAGKVVREFYQQAADLLKHPVLTFDETARATIAEAFCEVVADRTYTCYACAIMPDHVHVLIRKHKRDAETMMELLKVASTQRLKENNVVESGHPVWADGGWKVFLDHPDEIRRTIPYIEKNPKPLGLPSQNWPFVKAYDGWPLHPGHSPNSPYVRALKAAGRYPS